MLIAKPVFLGHHTLLHKLHVGSLIMNAATFSRQMATKIASTIDTAEIEKFSRMSAEWWDEKNGPLKTLHTLNKIRVPFVIETLTGKQGSAALKNKKILDVGCGGGILCESLAKQGATVTGIDATKDVIAIACQHLSNNRELEIKPTYVCTTIEEHASKHKNYYEAVVASEVIEHVNNKELFVKACIEALKPGGKIFFTTPSRTRISQMINIWGAEDITKVIPKGAHEYNKFMTPKELQALLEINGCRIEDIRGYMLNIITTQWSWTRSKNFFFAIQAVKENKNV